MSTEFKHYRMPIADVYEVNLNRICKSNKFKGFMTSKMGILKNGLTVSCYNEGNEENPQLYLKVQRKIYGYDHSCNNGTEYTDLGDYISERHTKEEEELVKEYFEKFEPELYKLFK